MNATLTSIVLFFVGLVIGIVLIIIINFLKNKTKEHKAIDIVEKAKKDAEKVRRERRRRRKEGRRGN